MNDNKPIIIAGNPPKHYLFVIALRGLTENSIKLQFSDKHAGTAEYVLRLLRKSCGWEEVDREKVETMNIVCAYERKDVKECKNCGHQTQIKTCGNPKVDPPKGCDEYMRTKCKGYKRKYNNIFVVNEVTIEKIGQARI